METWESHLHSQGMDVSHGTLPDACPLPTSNARNEASEPWRMKHQEGAENSDRATGDQEENPHPQENYSMGGTRSPSSPPPPSSANYSEIISPLLKLNRLPGASADPPQILGPEEQLLSLPKQH